MLRFLPLLAMALLLPSAERTHAAHGPGGLESFQGETPEIPSPFQAVQCDGTYRHHLQGICTNDKDAIYWSFTTALVKTDTRGKVLKKINVKNHHGDVCHQNGKIYVAVNFGKFNDPEGNADSWVYVYQAHDLSLISKHETQEVVHGAGGIGHRDGRFFVVGGLPDGVPENYVYEYDGEFHFLKKHVIKSGHTFLGIQTATYAQGKWFFGCYGDPEILLITDAQFEMKGRYRMDCSLGIVGLPNGQLLSASGQCDDGSCTGRAGLALADDKAGLLVEPIGAASRNPPNIVVILVDDLRWDEISCAGHPFVRTPGIDRIAREGARFRNAFCTTPLCSPVRASLLTGLYAHHHGIIDNTNRSEQSHSLMTFPRILNRHGYDTGYVGKWHMGNDDSARPGFSYWAGLRGQGTSFDPVLNENGAHLQLAGHTTDVLNDRAVRFIRGRGAKPFCLYLAHKALHPELVQFDDGSVSDPSGSKFLPATRHQKLYKGAAIPRRLNVMDTLAGKPALLRPVAGLPPLSRSTGTADGTIRDRLRMLAAVDEGVRQIFAVLEETGQLDHTAIVFTSDHGYWNGEHGLSVERRLAYEEALRIPLLIRFPAVIAPRIIDDLVLSIDVAPTLLELAQASGEQSMDGRSLVPLLEGNRPTDWRDEFLIEYYSDTVFPRIHTMGYRAVRTQTHKYIRYSDLTGMDELYDLQRDPYEMQNVIDAPAYQGILADLKAALAALTEAEPEPSPRPGSL